MKRIAILTLLVVLMLWLATALTAASRYEVIDLGTLGGSQSIPYGLNNFGQVSGGSNLNGVPGYHAFLWQDGTMIDVNPPGYGGSYAYGINDNGEVVGMTLKSGSQYAFLWSNNTATVFSDGYACAINNSGDIVGYCSVPGAKWPHAFLYRNGIRTDLGAFSGDQSTANSINNYGQIVGDSLSSNGNRAVMWQNGSMIDLGGLGGTSNCAKEINDVGEVVGYSSTLTGEYHAVLWRNGSVVDLGMLGGYTTCAEAINIHHQVVGWSIPPSGSIYGAFIWQDGVMFDINNLLSDSSGWKIYQALDINDSGQIIGYAGRNGVYNAVLLNPVPEPSTILTLLSGIGGIGGVMWRKRK